MRKRRKFRSKNLDCCVVLSDTLLRMNFSQIEINNFGLNNNFKSDKMSSKSKILPVPKRKLGTKIWDHYEDLTKSPSSSQKRRKVSTNYQSYFKVKNDNSLKVNQLPAPNKVDRKVHSCKKRLFQLENEGLCSQLNENEKKTISRICDSNKTNTICNSACYHLNAKTTTNEKNSPLEFATLKPISPQKKNNKPTIKLIPLFDSPNECLISPVNHEEAKFPGNMSVDVQHKSPNRPTLKLIGPLKDRHDTRTDDVDSMPESVNFEEHSTCSWIYGFELYWKNCRNFCSETSASGKCSDQLFEREEKLQRTGLGTSDSFHNNTTVKLISPLKSADEEEKRPTIRLISPMKCDVPSSSTLTTDESQFFWTNGLNFDGNLTVEQKDWLYGSKNCDSPNKSSSINEVKCDSEIDHHQFKSASKLEKTNNTTIKLISPLKDSNNSVNCADFKHLNDKKPRINLISPMKCDDSFDKSDFSFTSDLKFDINLTVKQPNWLYGLENEAKNVKCDSETSNQLFRRDTELSRKYYRAHSAVKSSEKLVFDGKNSESGLKVRLVPLDVLDDAFNEEYFVWNFERKLRLDSLELPENKVRNWLKSIESGVLEEDDEVNYETDTEKCFAKLVGKQNLPPFFKGKSVENNTKHCFSQLLMADND